MAKRKTTGKTQTTAQIGYSPQTSDPYNFGLNQPNLYYNWPNTFNTYTNATDLYRSWEWRLILMRNDPTLALLRQLWIAPILSAGWSVEADDDASDEAIDYAHDEMGRLHQDLIPVAGLGCLDWGWAPFEQIFTNRPDGKLGLKQAKSLLQQMTTIKTDEKTGEYIGLSQDDVFLDLDHSILFNFDVIGTNYYGSAPMKAAEQPWYDSTQVDDRLATLNVRVAGEHWVIYYPVGVTSIDGTDTDNFEVAEQIMEKMLQSGSVAVPNEIRSELNILNADAGTHEYQCWRIELLSSGETSSAFYLEQQRYNDILKARALGFPERSVFEGEHGTKAEAGVHTDAAVQQLEKRSQELTQSVSRQVLKPLVEFNFGADQAERISLVANPIVDSTLQLWLRLYEQFLNNGDVLVEEFDNINMREVREKLGIPQYDEGTENPDPLKDDIADRPDPIPPAVDDDEPTELSVFLG